MRETCESNCSCIAEAEQEPSRNNDERRAIIFCHSKDFDLDGFWFMAEALKTDDYVMELLAMDELDVTSRAMTFQSSQFMAGWQEIHYSIFAYVEKGENDRHIHTCQSFAEFK